MTIQNLIDAAADEFFANHEEGLQQTHAVALHDDGTAERFPIENGARLVDFKDTFQHARVLAEGAGASKHMAFHYVKDQGNEAVLIAVQDSDDCAVIAFAVTAHTADAAADLTLVTGMGDLVFARPSDWEGEETIIGIDAAPMGHGHA